MGELVNNARVPLRLATQGASRRIGRNRNPARAAARVSRENASAARASRTDARWMLAVRTAAALEGGKLAMLRPERRRELVAMATRVGLRDFDANLVIAIVQDGARTGQGALGGEATDRLTMIRARTKRAGGKWSVLIRMGIAVAGAVVIVMALVRWLVGGE